MKINKIKNILSAFVTQIHQRLYGTIIYRYYSNSIVLKKILKKIYYFIIGTGLESVHTISIETLTACNLRCSYCPNSVYERGLIKNNQYMKIELFEKIIDELSEINWSGIIQPHSYGEPLLDKRLEKLCSYTREKLPNATISIVTNGELLSVDIYKNLIKAGADRFKVTQHLSTESKGTLDVINYRKQHGDDGVYFTYNKLEIINSRGGLVDLPTEVSRSKQECNYPDYHIGFHYNGEIMMCCNDYLNDVKIGNISNEKLLDIWYKPNYINIRKDIREGNFTLDICKNCSDATIYSTNHSID